MRRFFSWVTLGVCEWIFAVVAWYVVRFGVYLFYLLRSKVGGLAWLAVGLEASAAFGFFLVAIFVGTKFVVSASQTVWRSKAGARYIVFGVITSVLMGALLIFSFIGAVSGGDLPSFIGYCAVMFLFGLFLIGIGKGAVNDDGLPPTKKEVLEAKLAALEEKERKRNGQDA